MISELAADLVAKVETIAALVSRTSLSIGGRTNDPGLLKIPLPAAWIVLKQDAIEEPGYAHESDGGLVSPSQRVLATFAVTVFIDYLTDADMLAVQFPLLELVVEAIHGKDAGTVVNGQAISGYRWRYIGQKLALVYPDRMAYEQRYTVSYVTNA